MQLFLNPGKLASIKIKESTEFLMLCPKQILSAKKYHFKYLHKIMQYNNRIWICISVWTQLWRCEERKYKAVRYIK